MKFLKALIVGASLLAAGHAYAQATAPTAPTPPTIVATSPNETAAGAVATTNKIYIDQSGDNVDINIVQAGSTNVIGAVNDPIYLRGAAQSIIAIQNGDSNSILASLVTGTGSGDSATVTLQQIGNSNQITMRCGNAATDSVCTGLNMNAKFTGDSNSLNYHGSGANMTNSMDVTGNSNALTIDSLSPNASQTIKVAGDYNTFNISQTGSGGSVGHSLSVDLTGTGNSFTSSQDGLETVINVKSVTNGSTININTHH
jgi:hypothetical protein